MMLLLVVGWESKGICRFKELNWTDRCVTKLRIDARSWSHAWLALCWLCVLVGAFRSLLLRWLSSEKTTNIM